VIDPNVLPLFFTAIFFLAISPGPDLLLISTYSSTKGFASGVMISMGVLMAGVVQTCLVAFGLGELMMIMPGIAIGIKWVGAIYLTYLGVRMLWAWFLSQRSGKGDLSEQELVESNPKQKPLSNSGLFSKGLLNNLLNPKALLFFSLFLPQFISSESALTSQILLLGLMLSAFVFIINLLFSLGFSRLGKLMSNKLNLTKHIDGFLGVIFMGLAVRLASSK